MPISSRWSDVISRAWSRIWRRTASSAAADHAVARRHQLRRHRPAASGAALPVGPRRRCHGRPGGRPRGGIDDLITVDIGGTSCDIALVSGGQPLIRAEGVIGGYSVRVPMVDVNAIGAGGGRSPGSTPPARCGSGPQSAGSEPGPACYGRGGERGDGHRCIARPGLSSIRIISRAVRSSSRRTSRAETIETTIAAPLGIILEHAALGIHRVLNAQMAEAIRLVSIGRGIDPARLHAPAAGRWRAAACDGAGARAGHPTHRRAAASRRVVGDRPALRPDRA